MQITQVYVKTQAQVLCIRELQQLLHLQVIWGTAATNRHHQRMFLWERTNLKTSPFSAGNPAIHYNANWKNGL